MQEVCLLRERVGVCWKSAVCNLWLPLTDYISTAVDPAYSTQYSVKSDFHGNLINMKYYLTS